MTTNKKMSILYFSPRERKDLLISWIVLSLAFAIVLMKVSIFGDLLGANSTLIPQIAIPLSFIAVGTGFVFHELAHREAAKHYGFHSEYRAWYPMLLIAVIFALFTGWIFAAPGATYFFGQNITRRQNGIISAAGPIINLILGTLFLLLGLGIAETALKTILLSAAMINFWFAMFNLLPIFMLDGSKVIKWNFGAWLGLFAISAFFVFGLGFVI